MTGDVKLMPEALTISPYPPALPLYQLVFQFKIPRAGLPWWCSG